MLRPELYKKTVDILVAAYFNDTLEHGSCHACAVGNIIAESCGFKLDKTTETRKLFWRDNHPEWNYVFVTLRKSQLFSPTKYEGVAKEQIDATGYTWQELAMIEKAFETAPEGENSDEYMFSGLMKVIEVLDKIHENNDEETTLLSKKKFNKLQTTNQ